MAGLGAGQHPWFVGREGKWEELYATDDIICELKMVITDVMEVSFRVA